MRARDAEAMRFVAMALVMVACASCGADVSPGEFRVAKIEQAWNKAQRIQLSAVQLSDLHGELRMLERQELSVKRDGHVEEQQTEQLNRNLLAVLARYGLDGGKKENFGLNSNRLMEFGDSKPFRDPKLNKMWEKARASGRFENAGDLQRLERDFHLHDERIQEYEAMVIQSTGHNMNTVDGAGIPDKQLKEERSKLHNSLQRLRELMSMGYVNSEFTEPVAMELWEMAQQANLSEKELHDVKEELLTLERISEKHSHFREQLQVSHEKLQHAKATYDDVPFDKTAQDSKRENVKLSHDVDRLGETQRRHNELTDKTRSLAYKGKPGGPGKKIHATTGRTRKLNIYNRRQVQHPPHDLLHTWRGRYHLITAVLSIVSTFLITRFKTTSPVPVLYSAHTNDTIIQASGVISCPNKGAAVAQ